MSRAAAVLRGSAWQEIDVEDAYFRPVQPDALLEVAAITATSRIFVEYDRTRRVDKNYDKFLRYETLLVVLVERDRPEAARASCSSARTPTTGSASWSPPTTC